MPRRKKEDELPEDQRGPPRGAANLRERTRMRVLSKAFGKLKLMLPWVPPDTKLSKLDTLRLATSYISHLQRVLDENGEESGFHPEDDTKLYPQSSVGCWPYGHHRLNLTAPSSKSLKSTPELPFEEDLMLGGHQEAHLSYFANNNEAFVPSIHHAKGQFSPNSSYDS